MFPGAEYSSQTESITPGDRIIFYTDGLADRPTAELLDCILDSRHLTATEMLDRLVNLADLESISDDLTILVAAID